MDTSEAISEREFTFVRDLIYEKSGIVIGDHKKEMITRRLAKRVRQLNLVDISEYCSVLKSASDQEMIEFLNVVTTNLTSFFREAHHFEYLKDEYFPKFIAGGGKKLRIWSSASSTGEEPYSIAITMLDSLGDKVKTMDVKILATDLDTEVLKKAKEGTYKQDRIENLPSSMISKWFDKQAGGVNFYVANHKLKSYLTFNKLNLLGHWPMKGMFDVIFCRNVLIYFDRKTQQQIVDRFHQILQPGGLLMLGHSESVLKSDARYNALGKTIYQKK
jgi:chemotaxis protein methyltransferase CheR